MSLRKNLSIAARGLPSAALAVMVPLTFAFAQQAVPGTGTEAAPPACPGPGPCTPNPGDTAWMLASVALVLMMTIPGLGLFYGGMVRKKNVADTVMASFAVTCLVTVLWA